MRLQDDIRRLFAAARRGVLLLFDEATRCSASAATLRIATTATPPKDKSKDDCISRSPPQSPVRPSSAMCCTAGGGSTARLFVNPFERAEIGPDLFGAARGMGLVDLVSKRGDRPYQARRGIEEPEVSRDGAGVVEQLITGM